MKTLSQLKKELQVGKKLLCLYHFKGDNMKEKERIIQKVNTVGVKFENGFTLDFPASAELVEYESNIFTIYSIGKRPLNEEEKQAKEEAQKTYTEQEKEYDIITDCSITYHREKAYLESKGFGYLMGKGQEIQDKQIKGEKLYTFKIV